MAVAVFLDASVLLAGLIDFGPQSAPAQSLMHAIADKRVTGAATAWHCCLEFYSVSTRLPPEFRLTPADAVTLLEDEIVARVSVHDLPASDRLAAVRAAARDQIGGGRIYDAHIAEVARAAGAGVVVICPVQRAGGRRIPGFSEFGYSFRGFESLGSHG